MKTRRIAFGMVVLSLAGAAAFYGWHWYSTPAPPEVPLAGVRRERVEKIQLALDKVRREPRSGNAWGELALTLMVHGFYEEAMPCFIQAERFDPGQARWPYFHSSLLFTYATNQDEGMAKLRQARDLAVSTSDRGPILFKMAIVLVEDGQLEEAERCLAEFRELGGNPAAIEFALGLIAMGRGDRSAASAHLSGLTDNPAARKRALLLLAALANDRALAQDYRLRAEELPDDQPWPFELERELQKYRAQPEDRPAYLVLKDEGREDEAFIALQEHFNNTPDEQCSFALGLELLKLKQFAPAERAFGKALEFNPHNVKAHLFRGVALLQVGEKRLRDQRRDAAMESFRLAVQSEDAALKIQNDLADAHLTRGQALKHLGRTDEAIAAFRQAASVGAEYAEVHQALGEALAETGHLREGLEYLENAVRLARPNNPNPRAALEKWQAKSKPEP